RLIGALGGLLNERLVACLRRAGQHERIRAGRRRRGGRPTTPVSPPRLREARVRIINRKRAGFPRARFANLEYVLRITLGAKRERTDVAGPRMAVGTPPISRHGA